MPEIKFNAICYNPKPSPTPSAPPKTATAVRSIPTTFSSNRKNHHEDGDFEQLCRHFSGPRVERLLCA
jgi:hypothetical protein